MQFTVMSMSWLDVHDPKGATKSGLQDTIKVPGTHESDAVSLREKLYFPFLLQN